MIRPAELIEKKRDGGELTRAEIRELIIGYARREVPDYQLSAFCMAVFFRGLTPKETFALTDAMIASGEVLQLGKELGRVVVDKHSTGGVGDKTSLAVGPIVAACGVPFGKMSGRGLGITGGTLDKLEAIPGFRVELTTAQFIDQIREVGLAIVGQSANLVPADKLLYALRDVTATVDQRSLIAASIMSKKLAAGTQAVVLDVKVGDGAFMKNDEVARELAETMIEIGAHGGQEVVCLLTDMNQPLGAAVGNALEIREAIATLRGEGPEDFTELVYEATARILALSDLGVDETEGRRLAEAAVADGSAEQAWNRWIEAQGGEVGEDQLEWAPVIRDVVAPRSGFVTQLSALRAGRVALHLGAGRRTSHDMVDHRVGVVFHAKRGAEVKHGEVLAQIHAADDRSADEAAYDVIEAYEFGDDPPANEPVLIDVVR